MDFNASAPLLDCARDAMVDALDMGGNASSVHFEGRNARKIIEQSRVSLARLVDAEPKHVIFTSGASEAANHVLSRRIRTGRRISEIGKLYRSAIEHPCILAGGGFGPDMVEVIPVTETGVVDTGALESMLERDKGLEVPMVAVMLANNETGVIQPIEEIAAIVRARGGYLVVDAVQALGKIPFSMKKSGAHFAFFSSHKIGGPQGSGALVLADHVVHPAEPLVKGGGQENRHRAGTENTAAIAGFGAACEWHLENLTKNVIISSLRDSIEERLGAISLDAGNGIAQPVFFGKQENRLPNTSCFSVAGVNAETALVALDLEGISVSTGSACSSGRIEPSHVLRATGASPELASGAIRLSMGWEPDHIGADRFLETWKTIVGRMA